MLVLYLLVLASLALLTAYTRNFQRTLVALQDRVQDVPAATITPRAQGLRTAALVVGWPLAFGVGMLFIAWWKAVALVVGAFLLLVPVMGSLTPRPLTRHYVERIRSGLERRLARGGRDTLQLRRLLEQIDQFSQDRGAP